MRPGFKYLLLSILVIIFDQSTKLLVHFTMEYGLAGQIMLLGDWLKLHYTLNPGMAFGMQLGGENGKLLLTSFRMLAIGGLVFYLFYLIRQKAHPAYLTCIALITGGAAGNLIDSIFYGVLLGNAPEGSPSPWLHGQVVDMIYVDIWEGFLPDWIPVLGGQYYALWPIFNVADATIFCSIIALMLFGNKWTGPEPTEAVSPAEQH